MIPCYSGYDCIAGGDGDYFIATLLRRGRVYKDESRIIEFPGTAMSRSLLSVSAHCGQVRPEKNKYYEYLEYIFS